ncbi:uncharacterized protein FOBCDRAFT_241544 [Fusarium oxysporum Fo47]|uniref:uncharacterized protein n=1 Tax=Fusarium oxysporum Fo47 TaxID=660027 RepID=UPI002869A202|nr:uncharacterized protein FOBCDRAFT_241544 [Fusarium oxysporum Fo47]QKD56831.2 hypothetical protein FOBCDRAFT_241544 [Fusarium oxysporum Fo47]
MTARVRRECVRFQLSEDLSSQLQVIWEHKVWKLFDYDFGEAMDEVPARPEYQLLQDEAILFNALQSKDFDDEQGEEEAYSDDEDEDTDSMFGYDEGDCDNSEVASNPAEADENHHADRASKMWDESDTV